MRIKLTIHRHSLGTVKLLWDTTADTSSTSFITSTSSDGSSSTITQSTTTSSNSRTVAWLLESVNRVCPLEHGGCGLEDYVVEMAGYELLHFGRLEGLVREGEEVVIRQLDPVELRERKRIGRRQISTAGRKLIDGAPFGRAVGFRAAWDRPAPVPVLEAGSSSRKRQKANDGRGRAVRFIDDGDDENEDQDEEEEDLVKPVKEVVWDEIEYPDSDDEEDDEDYVGGSEDDEEDDFSDDSESDESEEVDEIVRVPLAPPQVQKQEKVKKGKTVTATTTKKDKGAVTGKELVRYEVSDSQSDGESKKVDKQKQQHKLKQKEKKNVAAPVAVTATTTTAVKVPLKRPASLDSSSSSSSESFVSSSSESESESDSDSSSSATSDAESESESDDESSSSSSSSESDSDSTKAKKTTRNKATKVNSATTQASTDAQGSTTAAQTGIPFNGSKKTAVRRERLRRAKLRRKLVDAGLIDAGVSGEDFGAWLKNNPKQAREYSDNFTGNKPVPAVVEKGKIQIDSVKKPEVEKVQVEAAPVAAAGQQEVKLSKNAKKKAAKLKKDMENSAAAAAQIKKDVQESAVPAVSAPVSSTETSATPTLSYTNNHYANEEEKAKHEQQWLQAAYAQGASKRKKSHIKKRVEAVPKKWVFGENGEMVGVPTAGPDFFVAAANPKIYEEDGEAVGAEEVVEPWRKKITLSAVECEHEGAEVPQPTFPFMQPNINVPSRAGQKRKRGKGKGKNGGQQQQQQQQQDRNQYAFDAYAEGGKDYNQTDDWYNNNYYDDETVHAEPAAAKVAAPVEEKDEGPDLPALPADVNTLPAFTKDHCQPGAIVAFKQLTMDEYYNPILANYKTAEITEVENQQNGEICLWVRLAKRDRKVRKYDEETGDRILSKFEMPGDDEEDEGIVEIMFGEMVDPKLVKEAEKVEGAAIATDEAGFEELVAAAVDSAKIPHGGDVLLVGSSEGGGNDNGMDLEADDLQVQHSGKIFATSRQEELEMTTDTFAGTAVDLMDLDKDQRHTESDAGEVGCLDNGEKSIEISIVEEVEEEAVEGEVIEGVESDGNVALEKENEGAEKEAVEETEVEAEKEVGVVKLVVEGIEVEVEVTEEPDVEDGSLKDATEISEEPAAKEEAIQDPTEIAEEPIAEDQGSRKSVDDAEEFIGLEQDDEDEIRLDYDPFSDENAEDENAEDEEVREVEVTVTTEIHEETTTTTTTAQGQPPANGNNSDVIESLATLIGLPSPVSAPQQAKSVVAFEEEGGSFQGDKEVDGTVNEIQPSSEGAGVVEEVVLVVESPPSQLFAAAAAAAEEEEQRRRARRFSTVSVDEDLLPWHEIVSQTSSAAVAIKEEKVKGLVEPDDTAKTTMQAEEEEEVVKKKKVPRVRAESEAPIHTPGAKIKTKSKIGSVTKSTDSTGSISTQPNESKMRAVASSEKPKEKVQKQKRTIENQWEFNVSPPPSTAPPALGNKKKRPVDDKSKEPQQKKKKMLGKMRQELQKDGQSRFVVDLTEDSDGSAMNNVPVIPATPPPKKAVTKKRVNTYTNSSRVEQDALPPLFPASAVVGTSSSIAMQNVVSLSSDGVVEGTAGMGPGTPLQGSPWRAVSSSGRKS
ncbi:hypothetical protein DFH27DRAFT_547061 [Peziza echinospora]|nr:hypothetical protein DFH27DRAFT_547061 [Peziza echinospora]